MTLADAVQNPQSVPEPPEIGGAPTVARLLSAQAKATPHGIAIAAPGRGGLTYERLWAQVEQFAATLNGIGISRNDRVAIVLPNGPEMAAAFLAVAATATTAPLNPDYRAEEFEFYLSDIKARALIVGSTLDTPAREVARKRGIDVFELCPGAGAEAGVFSLSGQSNHPAAIARFAEADDVALLLHTSGSTSRPKPVPLSQRNLLASAAHIRRTLQLTAADRCLNVMPLFHIHGLIAAVLSSLSAGGSVVCTPGCLAPKFFGWMEEFVPTWYTAVPTMHQAILARAAANRHIIDRVRLRFIRSSSAALPPRLMAEVEEAFGCPVIEAYGMTEAAHQMASNPLPPLPRKPGSVGQSAGPEIAIMDDGGRILPQGERGEVVIRGANVTTGYESNPNANATAFTTGWFRTGDQGYLDGDGYLFLTGRLKEIINRGGEKISPREVDEVLLEHPAVAQAVTFAVPDARLGEMVGAAIVLRPGTRLSEQELCDFASSRLADFKVPGRVVFVEQIPKGPTGKLQRIGLAEKLGLTATVPSAAPLPVNRPLTATEEALLAIWKRVLAVEKAGIRDNFFELGGDSLLAVQMLLEVEKQWHRRLRVSALCLASTVEQLGAILDDRIANVANECVVAIQPAGRRPPLFCVHGLYGDVLCFRALAAHLGTDQPLYGVQSPEPSGNGRLPTTIPAMAERYLADIRAVQPAGPYFLAGLSFGGLVACEIARLLLTQGETVGLLALLDTNGPNYRAVARLRGHVRKLMHLPARGKLSYLRERAGGWMQKSHGIVSKYMPLAGRGPGPTARRGADILAINRRATMAYKPEVYPGRMTLFRAMEREEFFDDDPLCWWGGLAAGGVEVHPVPGNHDQILREPQVRVLAGLLQKCLSEPRESHTA